MGNPAETTPVEPTSQQMWDAELAVITAGADATTKPEAPAESVAAVAPVATVAPAAPVADTTRDDPYSGLHPSLRLKLEGVDALAERLRKAEGHIGGLSSENKRLKDEFAAATRVAAAAVTSAPSQAQVATAQRSTAKWDQLKTEFPEWADALEERLGGDAQPNVEGMRNQIREELTSQLTTSISATLKAEIAAETEGRLVNAAHRNWRDTVKTKAFADWYSKQPAEFQALGASPRAEDAMALLDHFKAQQAANPAADPAAIKAARAARLVEAAGVARGNANLAPTKSTNDMTGEEYWHYLAAQAAAEKSARR